MVDEESAARRDADAARSLETELLYLRKGAGCTPVRIAKTPVLLGVLGGRHQTFETHRERLVSAIQSLRDPAPALLMSVFGMAPETAGMASLRTRRIHYGRTIDRGVDTVADQEGPALEHLRSQLITGWYPKSPLSVRVPESHNGVVQESVSILTIVKDRRWVETREHYHLFAAFDEADYLTISASFPGRVTAEGDFTVRTKRIEQSYSHQFWHATPMRRGQFYDLRFRTLPQEDDDFGDLTEISRAFHEPTRYASFEARFIGEQPKHVWSYSGLTYLERPGVWSDGLAAKLVDGSARSLASDLYGGLHHGIAWMWG